MNDTLNKKALFIDFDSTFVKAETIDELAKFSLRGDPNAEHKVRMISHITDQAMCGEISFPDALEKRLDLLSISRDDVDEIQRHISTLVSDSFIENRDAIRSMSDSIWILSGGFTEVITPNVSEFGISEDHVLANRFTYSDDRVTGCDRDSDLCKDKGKIRAIENLNLDRDIIMIGDGFTDYEVYRENAAKAFICYTENVSRDSVVGLSHYQAKSFGQVLDIVKKI